MATVKPLYARLADGEYDVQPAPGGVGTMRLPWSKGLQKDGVEIFALSDEVAYSAQLLTGTLPDIVPTDLSQIRLPYPKVAFEFPLSTAITELRTKQNKALFGTDRAGTNHIETVGMYAQALGDGVVFLQPYWKFEAVDIVQISPLTVILGAGNGSKYHMRDIEMRHPGFPNFVCEVGVALSPAWIAAMSEEEMSRFAGVLQNADTFALMAQEAIEELPTALFAALMLINCKSGITVARIPAKVAPSGYGKRLKRKHSSPAFTVLALSEVESVSPTGVVTKRSDLSAHYVRGHFKSRKSGLYWWNSFIRGSGTPRKRRAYIVKET